MSFSDSFCPWLFGSQTCEKIFRAARSMTSTFSTVINFGILALLRRLHRLHMQFSLESEADRTGIIYPRACSHKKKEGHNKSMSCNSMLLTNEEILEAVEKGRSEAQSTIESLGMAKLLQDNIVAGSIHLFLRSVMLLMMTMMMRKMTILMNQLL